MAETPAGPQAPAAPAAAPPAAPPPKAETPSLPPLEMIGSQTAELLREQLRSGAPVVVEIGKSTFEGRIYRLMLDEGWLAVEHTDGRRRAFMLIQGGRIRLAGGREVVLPALK